MAFYGESYELVDGTVIAGGAKDFELLRFRRKTPGSVVLAAGETIMWGSYSDPQDPEAFAALDRADYEIYFVAEIVSGTGTVHVTAGLDPDWTFTNPALATEDLGSYTVTGPGRLVAGPFASVTHEQLLAVDASVACVMECTSGSLEVTQVKLRIWPVGGPTGGAWRPYEGDTSNARTSVSVWTELGGTNEQVTDTAYGDGHIDNYLDYPEPDGARDAAQDALTLAQADLASKGGSSFHFTGTFAGVNNKLASSRCAASNEGWFLSEPGEPTFYGSKGNALCVSKPGYIKARTQQHVQPNVSPLGAAHPNEVWGDFAWVRPAGGGELDPFTPVFAGWTTATFRVRYETSFVAAGEDTWTDWPLESAVLQQHTIGDFTPGPIDPTWNQPTGIYQVYAGGAQTAVGPGGDPSPSFVEADVPFAGGECMAVAVHVPGINGSATSHRGLVPYEYEGETLHSYSVNSAATVYPTSTAYLVSYVEDAEVWDPSLPWEPELEPRFYVKDLAGVMRPVGFGKPADEAAVFRVPTAQGWFRDLTTAEYATYGPDSRPSGGYPLKVKRVDTAGETWWDHVAWLVPDES